MALHTDLPIHRTGVRLLALAIKAQEQMPREVKRSLGDKVSQHCVDFVGHVVKPWHRTTRRGTVGRAVARLQDLPAADVHQVANSYFGLFTQATHSHADRAQLAHAALRRGHCVDGALKKSFRRTA